MTRRYFPLVAVLLFLFVLSLALSSCDTASPEESETQSESETASRSESQSESQSESESASVSESISESQSESESESESEQPETVTYTVTVTANGQNVRASIKIFSGTTEVASKTATGTATFELPEGDYTVSVTPAAAYASYYYDTSSLTLSAASPTLTVSLIPTLTAVKDDTVYPWDSERSYPYCLAASGVSYVTVTDEDRSVFVFRADTAGLYRISLTTLDGKTVPVKYYGTPMSCFEIAPTTEGPDNAFFIIEAQDAHTAAKDFPGFVCMVFNDTGESYDALLTVERIGDEVFDPSFDEYINVTPEKPLTPLCFSYANWSYTVNNLDITDESLTVVLGEDGYYHLGTKDGPLVYAYVAKPSPYIEFSFHDVCAAGDRFGAHFAGDEIYRKGENEYTHKELYNILIEAYAAACDPATGLYPMTEELAHAIKSHGEHAGWWGGNPALDIFFKRETEEKTVDYKENVAWLFACATVEITEGTAGYTASAPIEGQNGGTVVFDTVDTLYFSVSTDTVAVTLVSDESSFSVSYNGAMLTPTRVTDAETGASVYKVTVNITQGVTAFSVTYTGSTENATLDFTVATA